MGPSAGGTGELQLSTKRALQEGGECYSADEASGIAVRAVDAVSQTVQSLVTEMAGKADASTAAALQAALAQLQGTLAGLAASLGAKANSTDVDALSEQMEELSLSLEDKAEGADVVALTGTVSQHSIEVAAALDDKVDEVDMAAALAQKADESDVVLLTGTVSQHSLALSEKADETYVAAQ